MQRQAARLPAEIGKRGRAHAFEIAAIGREIEIKRKDVLLAQRALDLYGAHDLAQLRTEAAFGARLQQARDLHRQGGGAGHDAPVRRPLIGGAKKRKRINAAMRVEALVLVGDQEPKKARIDILGANRQAPAAVGGRVGTQQPPGAVEHDRAVGKPLPERRRPERGDEAGRARHRDQERGGGGGDAMRAPHRTARTSSLPVPVRPNRSARYMSST